MTTMRPAPDPERQEPDADVRRPLSPVSRRAFLLAGPAVAGAALLPGCGSSGSDYADCVYCDASGQDYQECDTAYCDYWDYGDAV